MTRKPGHCEAFCSAFRIIFCKSPLTAPWLQGSSMPAGASTIARKPRAYRISQIRNCQIWSTRRLRCGTMSREPSKIRGYLRRSPLGLGRELATLLCQWMGLVYLIIQEYGERQPSWIAGLIRPNHHEILLSQAGKECFRRQVRKVLGKQTRIENADMSEKAKSSEDVW